MSGVLRRQDIAWGSGSSGEQLQCKITYVFWKTSTTINWYVHVCSQMFHSFVLYVSTWLTNVAFPYFDWFSWFTLLNIFEVGGYDVAHQMFHSFNLPDMLWDWHDYCLSDMFPMDDFHFPFVHKFLVFYMLCDRHVYAFALPFRSYCFPV